MKVIIAAILSKTLLWAAPQDAPKLMNDLPTFFGLTENADDLSLLNEVYRKTEMKFKAEQSRDATILMPANEAFKVLDIRQLTYPQMMQILNYHNLPEVVKFGELEDGDYSFESVEGSHVNLTVTGSPEKKVFTLNEESKVLGDMLETPMGVAYVISRFLVPEDLLEVVKVLPKADTVVPNAAALEKLEVPQHVQESNRANDRYDENPATANHTAPETVEVEPLADAQGVLARRAREVPTANAKVGVLPFKPARARTEQREHTFRVLQKGKQRAFMPRTAAHPSPTARSLKKTIATPSHKASRPSGTRVEDVRGRGNLVL